MGITGLLPLLRSITRRVHIETLAGQAVAVDAYSWLHKGVFLCAQDLFHQRPTDSYVEYCISKITLLQKYNVRPILVFDGAPLPMKAGKESSRHGNREASRVKALELLSQGDHKAAASHIHKSIDVTPEMAYKLICELKILGIDYVVAPYEADAQMAFLDKIGQVAAIITEDSDMLLFGCKKMLYKLDRFGYADEVNLEHLGETTDIELAGFTLERFRQMCILSGCDYLDSIPGFGLKTCHKYFVKYKTAERVLQAVRAEFPSKVPDDFERDFLKAELTFCHQRVYDHRCQELVHLYPVSEEFVLSESVQEFGNWDFVGPHIEHAIAKAIAKGQIDPVTHEPFKTLRETLVIQDADSKPSKAPKVSSGPVKRSRFFQPVSKEEHAESLQKRLTIPFKSLPEGKENTVPLVQMQSRGISTKRFATRSTLAQDMSASKIPVGLYSTKPAIASRRLFPSKGQPVRLDEAQTSLLNFLKKT